MMHCQKNSTVTLARTVLALGLALPTATTIAQAPATKPVPPVGAAVAPNASPKEYSGRVLRKDEAPPPQATQSLMAQMITSQPAFAEDGTRNDYGCLFAVSDPEPKLFAIHDLVTIVISESSRGKSKQTSKAKKAYELDAGIQDWLTSDIISPGDLPAFTLETQKDFEGKADYQRADDFTARVTAEIVEIKPNGLLVLEAHRTVVQDEEEQTIMFTGVCRPEDVDTNNQVPSHRVADASIKKINAGMLRDTGEKGIVAKVLDAIFAF